MRWQFQGINLFSLYSLSSLSVADISSLYQSRAQPPITTPHRPLLNVYIVTLQTRRHFLTQKSKRANTGSYNKLWKNTGTDWEGNWSLTRIQNGLSLCGQLNTVNSKMPASCLTVSLPCSPHSRMRASLSCSSPALIRNISLRVTVLFQCL